jgi:hypothetical protein
LVTPVTVVCDDGVQFVGTVGPVVVCDIVEFVATVLVCGCGIQFVATVTAVLLGADNRV